MDNSEWVNVLPIYQKRLANIQSRMEALKERMVPIAEQKYKIDAIYDQIIFQLGDAASGDEFYSATEIDFADTLPVFNNE